MASARAWVVVAVLSAAAATHPRVAQAESAEAQVERLASEAVNAYRGADYNRAVELLTRAYEIRQVPALLYNLAKAYDKLGDIDHAYETYARYSGSADADPKLKAKADARLVVLENLRRKKAEAQRAMEPKPAPPPQQVQPPPQPAQLEPPTPKPPTAEEIAQQRREKRARERRRDRYIALGLGVGAVAFAGVAIGMSVSALQLHDQWAAGAGTVPEATRRQQKDDALLRAGVADGFYAATAVAVGVGAYFVYRGFRPERAAPSVALVPALSPTGGALVAVGTF